MPRVAGLRERQHQPIWDTLVRASGTTNPSVSSRTTLFGSTNVGSFEKTNLVTAGQLASDQTFVILSMRCLLYFEGTNRRVCMQKVISQLYWTLTLGEKPQFQAPAWYFPAGGGIWAFDSSTSYAPNNGSPEQTAILKLAKPIKVPVRQNIQVIGEFFKLGALDALNDSPCLNSGRSSDDGSVILFMLDGVKTRDVQ